MGYHDSEHSKLRFAFFVLVACGFLVASNLGQPIVLVEGDGSIGKGIAQGCNLEKIDGIAITALSLGNALNLTWTASSLPNIDHYNIYRSTVSGFTPDSGNYVANSSTNYFLDEDLIDHVVYYYRITAVKKNLQEGPSSDEFLGIPHDSVAPGKVEGFVVNVIPEGNSLELAWDHVSAPDLCNYRIYRSTTLGFTPHPAHYLVSLATNRYIDTGLTDGMPYYYRITAVDEVPNEGAPSSQTCGIPLDTVAPERVTGLSVINPCTGNTLHLSWTTCTAPDWCEYWIYRSTNPYFSPSPMYLLGATSSNAYLDTCVIDGVTYYYRVTARDEVPNEGAASAVVAGISTDFTPPAQVTGVTVTVVPTGNELAFSWTASAAADFDHYNIYRSTVNGFVPNSANLIAMPITNSYTDVGLDNGFTYYYRITGIDYNGNEGPPSNQRGGIPGDWVAPAQVTGVRVTVLPPGDALLLNWTASTASDFDHYRVYRSTVAVFIPSTTNLIASPTINSYVDGEVAIGLPYYYRVTAVDDDSNEGAASSTPSFVPPEVVPPPQVSGVNVVATPTGNQLDISWTAFGYGIIGYKIYRSTISGFTPGPTNLLALVSDSYFNDTGLIDGAIYYYRITAVDDDVNEGPSSLQVCGTPQDTLPPEGIAQLSVVNPGIGNILQLSWLTSSAPDLEFYSIYRNGSQIATSTSNFYTDSGLTDGEVYSYYITAVDEVPNEGPASTSRMGVPTDVTAPGKVVNLQVSVVPTENALSLSWSASAALDLAGYAVYRSTISGFTPRASNNIANVTTNSYLDTGFEDGIPYYYRIRAFDEVPNFGTASDECELDVDRPYPPKITGVSVSVDPEGNALNVTWTASSTPFLDHYCIYRSTTPGFTPGPSNNVANCTLTYYYDTNLFDDVVYYYRIRAVDSLAIPGLASDEACGTPHDSTPPEKVTCIRISIIPTGNSLNITWGQSNASDCVSYKIYRSTTANFTLSPVYLIGNAASNGFVDSSLLDDTSYYYRISAIDEVPNEGDASEEIVGITYDTIPPAKVTGLTVTVIPTGNSLLLSWQDSSILDFDHYNIYRSTISGFTPNLGNLIAVCTTNSFRDGGLDDGVTYYYRISANDEVPNEGRPSDEVNGIPHDSVAPSKVTGVRARLLSEEEGWEITWTPSASIDLHHYNVYKITSYGETPGPSNLIASPTINYYRDTNLSGGIYACYLISAVDEEGNEGVDSGTYEQLIPVIVGPNSVLFWVKEGMSYATIRYVFGRGGYFISKWGEVTRDEHTIWIDSEVWVWNGCHTCAIETERQTIELGALQQGNYTIIYRVWGENFTTLSFMAEEAVTVIPTGNSLKLSWTGIPGYDFTGYKIYRSTTRGFTPGPIYLIGATTNSYFYDQGLSNGVTYYYRIAIEEYWSYGDECLTGEVNGTTDDSVPAGKVTGLTISIIPTGNSLLLSWTASSVVDLDHYNIYRSTISGFTPNTANLIAMHTANSYIDSGLTDGVTYYYRISAVDDDGNEGCSSDEASGIPYDVVPPDQITGMSASPLYSGEGMEIEWTASSSADLMYYKVYRDSTHNFLPNASNLIATTTSNYYLDPLPEGYLCYSYRVSAVDAAGNEGLCSEADGGIAYVPPPCDLNLEYRLSNETVFISVSVYFNNGGFRVYNWGEILRDNYHFIVDTEIIDYPGGHTCDTISLHHTYELGELMSGSYTFSFRAWGSEVAELNFTVEASPSDPTENETTPPSEPPPPTNPPSETSIPVMGIPDSCRVWQEGAKSYFSATFTFPTSGYGLGWSRIIKSGNEFEINAELWRYNGYVLQVFVTETYTCELGELEPGEYDLDFLIWGSEVYNATFTIAEEPIILPPPVQLPPPTLSFPVDAILDRVVAGEIFELVVTINISDEFAGVYLIYWVNDAPPRFSCMELRSNYSNGMYIYWAEIPPQSPGTFVNYTIIIVDRAGLNLAEWSFSYEVVDREVSKTGVPLLIPVGVITAGAIASVSVMRSVRKEKRIKELLESIRDHPSVIMQGIDLPAR